MRRPLSYLVLALTAAPAWADIPSEPPTVPPKAASRTLAAAGLGGAAVLLLLRKLRARP